MSEEKILQENKFDDDIKCWQEVNGQQVEVECPSGVLASAEKAKERMSICKECPSYKPLVFMCTECGCLMPVKTKFNHTECPLNKW